MVRTTSRRPASRSGAASSSNAGGSTSAAQAPMHTDVLDDELPRRLLPPGSARVPFFGDAPGGTGWQQADGDGAAPAAPESAGGADDDGEWGAWEYEEHEHVVLLDLGPAAGKLVQSSADYSISGLETDTPFLSIGASMFAGAWDEALGSEIVLYDTQSAPHPSSHALLPLAPTPSDAAFARAPSTSAARIRFLPLRPPKPPQDPTEKEKGKKPRGRPIMTVEQRAQRALERAMQGKAPKRLTKEERQERARAQREKAAKARQAQDAQTPNEGESSESGSGSGDSGDSDSSSDDGEAGSDEAAGQGDKQSGQET